MERFEKNTIRSFRNVRKDIEILKDQVTVLKNENKILSELISDLQCSCNSKKSRSKRR